MSRAEDGHNKPVVFVLTPSTSTVSKYGIALVAIAAAILLRMALTPWMAGTFPLATVTTAVAFVVWYGGWGPALFTSIVGWYAAGFVFRGGFAFFDRQFVNEAVGLGVYLFSCASVIVLGEAMRAAQQRLQAQQEQLSSTNLALENKVEAQSLLAAIVASSEDAIISKTLDGRITSWNKGAERLFGYTAREAIGRSIHLIVPPEGREQAWQILDRIRHGERIDHLEVERVCKDGRLVNVSLTVSPVHDRHGLIIGASKTSRDITTRKQWEANLVRSEEAQRLLVGIHDATRGLQDPAAVMRETVTRVGEHFLVTRCAYGEVHETEDEITITRGFTRDLPTAAGRYPLDVFGPLMIGELKAGRTVIIGDVGVDPLTDTPLAHETYGRMQIVSMVCVPLLRGRRLAAILVMCDSRPRQWTADEAHLLEQVAERTLFAVESARANASLLESMEQRQLAVDALREADQRKDEFLATLAHELRNPLAPISSGLHILRTAGDNRQVASTAREIMERQVAQMVRLVDDLLDVARITTGKVEMRPAAIDIADAVRDAAETSRPLLDNNHQRLTLTLPEQPVHVNGDRTRLAQVFANLLNNSAKFSDRGQPIAIAVAREGRQAVVRVRDAGIGIPPESLPRIFDMFGQADGDLSRMRGGLGIGLSLVRKIAELHGGTVEAHSAGAGSGSEFVLRLPAIEQQRPSTADAPVVAPAPSSKRRILVVDDNTDAAESLAALLSINGHETRLAHDGFQAMTEAKAFMPDVVFLDIGMPALDGHETARRIRQEPWGKQMVLVALTGWGQSEDRKRSKDAGFNHHLVKPADPNVVTKLISSLA